MSKLFNAGNQERTAITFVSKNACDTKFHTACSPSKVLETRRQLVASTCITVLVQSPWHSRNSLERDESKMGNHIIWNKNTWYTQGEHASCQQQDYHVACHTGSFSRVLAWTTSCEASFKATSKQRTHTRPHSPGRSSSVRD